MNINRKIKKALSILLCLCMLLQYVPVAAFAVTTAEAGLCAHHTEHTANCGYVEGEGGCDYHCDVCLNHDHEEEATGAVEESTEPSTEEAEPAPVCDCGTDDESIHAVSCAVYVAPETAVCCCAEKCTGVNVWCDVCGFDFAQCGGTDTAAAYNTVASGTCGDNVTWELTGSEADGYTLTISGTGAMANYNSVSAVPWYNYRSQIKTVEIASGVTTIGYNAFRSCTVLTSVTIPDSVTTIDGYAFAYCSSLTEVTIPKNVTTIGDSAFYCCYALESVTLPEELTTIDNHAFRECENLTSVTVPASVTTIGDVAFNGSPAKITVAEGNPSYSSDAYGVLFNKDKTTLIHCPTNIEAETYTIPSTVTEIYKKAFSYCTALTTITIPASVTTIGIEAFYECTALTTITIPESVTTIGMSTFSGCTALTTITIPESVTSIGASAFYNCTELTTVTFAEGSALTAIGWSAFSYCAALTTITIPESVTNIGASAFLGCTALTTITIPASVTSIGYEAFSGCTALTTITIPASVTSIGNYAFYKCTALTTVNVPCTWNGSLYTFSSGVEVNDEHTPNADGYTDNGDGTHSFTCTVCSTSVTEAHNWANGFCSDCGSFQPAEGDGTIDSPYKIANAGNLYWFAAVVNGGYGDVEQNLAAHGVLTADIKINENVLNTNGILNGTPERTWTPIGNSSSNKYTGTFDGDSHTISGLYFNDGELYYVGLFGVVGSGSTVQNVGVIDSYFSGYYYVGGVVGYNNYGSITGCSNSATVSGSGRSDVGGVVGYNYKGTVTNCSNSGTVSGTYYVGGVVGENSSAGLVTGCSNSATVSGSDSAGGVVGNNYGTVENCSNSGNVSGSNDYAGGVVGYISYACTVTNCYNTGIVTGSYYVGGVVGFSEGGIVTNCYNTGSVTGSYQVSGVVTANSGAVADCYYLADSETDELDGTTAKSATEFASGEVAYLLQGYQTEQVWGQTLTGDSKEETPVLGGATVYKIPNTGCHSADNAEYIYSNNEAATFAPDHTHRYRNDGATVTYDCSACGDVFGTVTITVESGYYNGTAYEAVLGRTGVYADADITVTYVKDGETLESAPKDAGSYTASITVGDATVSARFTIEKVTLTISKVNVSSKDYDGTTDMEVYGIELVGIVGDEDVYIDFEGIVQAPNADAYWDYTTVTGLPALTLSGDNAGNYVLQTYDETTVFSADYIIYTRSVKIIPDSQLLPADGTIEQGRFTAKDLPEGYTVEGVVLTVVDDRIEANTENARVMYGETDVTENFDVYASETGLIVEVCAGHTFNGDGFCATGLCNAYEEPKKGVSTDSIGSEIEVYEIRNAGQLFWFAALINAGNTQNNAKLMNDITVPEGREWTPIIDFYGDFNGNFKTVSGLVVNSEENYVGMFGGGYYSRGTIRNLHLTNSTFTGASNVGGIAGYYEGYIDNCYVDGSVTVTGTSSVGALVGKMDSGEVTNCYAYASTAIGTYSSSYTNVTNVYYLSETDDGNGGKTDEQFASGEVAYLLGSAWGQTLSGDSKEAAPVLGGAKVYRVTNCMEETAYSNTDENIGHKWGDDGVCTVCGETKSETTTATVTLKYPTLSLKSEVRYNIYFAVTGVDGVESMTEQMGLVYWNSEPTDENLDTPDGTVAGADYNSGADLYVAHTNGIPAKNLADKLYFKTYIQLSDGTRVYSELQSYSAKRYAEQVLGSDESEDGLKALCVAMLNYGAEAQKYFAGRGEYTYTTLMNADLSDADKARVTAYSADMVEELTQVDSSKSLNFAEVADSYTDKYPTAYLKGAFALNYYFKPSAVPADGVTLYNWSLADYTGAETLTSTNRTSEVSMTEVENGYFKASYSGISARKIGETVFAAAVYEADGTTYCSGVIPYSLARYCKSFVDAEDAEMKDLAAAIIVYGYYAKAYFPN